jgi:hypothetical protein
MAFCRGALAAKEIHQAIWEDCADCNFSQFQPELSDETARQRRYSEKMRAFADEMRTALGVCSLDGQHDQAYCNGYNTEVRLALADSNLRFWVKTTVNPYEVGLGDGAADLFVHLWSETQVHHFRPCIPPDTDIEELTDVFLKYVEEDPDERRIDTATMLLLRAMYFGFCPGPDEKIKPHLEQCTAWRQIRGQFGTKNECQQAVVVNFRLADQAPILRELEPNEVLTTGRTEEQIRQWWFTTCPAGYESSLPLVPGNLGEIGASRYNCVVAR